MRKQRWLRDSTKVEFAAENVKKCLSPRGGMVRGPFSLSPDPGDPKVFLSMAAPANPKHLLPGAYGLIDMFASGTGFTREEADLSAVAEAVERYCAAYVQPNMTVLDSWKQMSESVDALHCSELPLFSDAQYSQLNFPYVPFLEDTPIRWVKGFNLTTQREKWVPAAVTWDSYLPLSEEESSICFGLMTGTACGSSLTQATINGLLEVVERDAFMIMWYNRLSLPRLDVCSESVADAFSEFFDNERFTVHLVNMTSDHGIPSVFGYLQTCDGKISIGGAARLTLEKAVEKTLFEMSQLFIGNKEQIFTNHPPVLIPEQITDYGLRLSYYTQPYAKEELEFTYASEKMDPLRDDDFWVRGEEKDQLERLVLALEQCGLEVIVVDITTPDVRELGMHVVKVLVPGAVMLPRSEKEKIMTASRIYEVPLKMGWLERSLQPDELNTSPHPFP